MIMTVKTFKYLGDSEAGVAIYLAFMIMALLLALGLGISAIAFGQIKTIRSMGDSVVALYAADSGIEKVLMLDEPVTMCQSNPSQCQGSLPNGATFTVQALLPDDPSCISMGALNYCIRSVGVYKTTRRAIQISR